MGARPPNTWAMWLGVAAVCAICATGLAQQRFELKDDGLEKVAEPDPESPEGKLQEVRRLIADGHTDTAAKRAKKWIKDHPNHPSLADAYLLKGDARVADGKFYKALFDYEYVVRAYPGSEAFHAALERELKIADAFGRGVKRHLWGMQVLPAGSEAEELYIRIQERAPASKIAERAGIELADYYYRRSEMQAAAEAYDLFLKNYPHSQWREHAMKRQILANLATFKGPRFDATGLIEAQRRLEDYKGDFPAAAEQIGADGLLTRVDETLATRAYLVAEWYEGRRNLVSARTMYKEVVRRHNGSAAARRAVDRLKVIEPELFVGEAMIDLGPAPGTEEPADRPPVVRPEGREAELTVPPEELAPPTPSTDAPPAPRRREPENK